MTVLHAGGKFDKNTYKVSGGLHGVGVSVVNALSEWLEVEVYRDGKVFYQKYKRGEPVAPVKVIGQGGRSERPARKSRSCPTARSSRTACSSSRRSPNGCASSPSSISSVTLRIVDLRNKSEAGGRLPLQGRPGRVREVHRRDAAVDHAEAVLRARGRQGRESGRTVEVEVAFQYNDQYSENIFTYVNNINTHEGGTHLVGFRTALTRTLNNYA